jgi:hypothetical protein
MFINPDLYTLYNEPLIFLSERQDKGSKDKESKQ